MSNHVIRLVLLLVIGAATVIPAAAQNENYTDPADLAAPDGAFTTINDTVVYYVERGPADGPPVILLHGFLSSTEIWQHTLDLLAETGYRAIAFDRPPFGLSDKNPELSYTLIAQANLTAELMDNLEIEQAVLVGHSAGGAVIAQFALLYPDRLNGLVFVDGAVGVDGAFTGDHNRGQPSFFTNIDPTSPIAQGALRAFFTSQFARDMLSQSFYDTSLVTPEMVERSSAWLRIKGWEAGLLAYTRDLLNNTDSFEITDLTQVEAPVLLMWGEEDRLVPLEVGERLHELFPNNTFITYPLVGHVPIDEVPEQFSEDLLAFLASVYSS